MYKTAECVTPNHPDKICDQISDAILDAYLKNDPDSRVAVEVMGGHGSIYVTGEVTSKSEIDIKKVLEDNFPDLLHNILHVNIEKQSRDIAKGVDKGGAGDQGIMKGYAFAETPELMPIEVMLARKLCQFLYERFPNDGKTQVTLKEDRTLQIDSVVASFQSVDSSVLEDQVRKFFEGSEYGQPNVIYANPAGRWDIGGFDADTGLTGRKLVVDNYGPQYPIGGGAFSGKDPSKVDRSAAYMARKIAVDVIKDNALPSVFVSLAYAIGQRKPLEVSIEFGDPAFPRDRLELRKYDLTPNGIIKFLDLKKPQYLGTAKWGHFGNGFKWDK